MDEGKTLKETLKALHSLVKEGYKDRAGGRTWHVEVLETLTIGELMNMKRFLVSCIPSLDENYDQSV